MSPISLYARFVNSTCWTRPDRYKIEEIRKQRDNGQARINAQAEPNGVIVRSLPVSGLFATATEKRPRMLGDFLLVVSGKGGDGEPPTELLSKFEGTPAHPVRTTSQV